MANISVTYTFSNSTTADATEVNQNFTDIVNGTSDGTKDFSINALTCAGAASFNGNVTLGNASTDDVTVTGSLASTIPIKTTNTYAFGAAGKGLTALYISAGTTYTMGIAAASGASANYTLTFPNSGGTAGYGYETNGSGTLSYKPMQTDTSAKSADYTVLDGDGIRTILMTTGSTARTVTLPTAADNSGRTLTVIKVDTGTGSCTLDGEGAETINGQTTQVLYAQYDRMTIVCDGTSWHILDSSFHWADFSSVVSYSGITASGEVVYGKREGDNLRLRGRVTVDAAAASTASIDLTLTIDSGVWFSSNEYVVGFVYYLDGNGTTTDGGMIFYGFTDGSDTNSIFITNLEDNPAKELLKRNGSSMFATGSELVYDFLIPISTYS